MNDSERQSTASNPPHPLLGQVYDELVTALKNRSTVSEVKRIVEKCPQVVQKKDVLGRCAVFTAVHNGADLEVVQHLVEQNPKALLSYVHEDCVRKRTPLHVAVERGSVIDDEVIKYLVRTCPQSLHVGDPYGCLPAHLAVIKGASLETVRTLVEPYPEALRVWNSSDELPLTLALFKYQHLASNDGDDASMVGELVRYLAAACPEALGDKSKDGRRALHVAAESGAPPGILAFLVGMRPQAPREASTIGDLPVHCAARSSHTPAGYAAFRYLAELWPKSVQLGYCRVLLLLLDSGNRENGSPAVPSVPLVERIRCGLDLFPPSIRMKMGISERIPLHLALYRDTPNNVLDLLLDRWPESIHELDNYGASILQVVSKGWKATLDTLQFLVIRDDRIVDARNANDGSIPLHTYAAMNARWDWDDTALDFVRFLVELRPESVMARDDEGCLPIHRAAANPKQSRDVIEYLVGLRTDTLAEKNHLGYLPLHVAVAKSDDSLATVEFLVEQRPESLREGDNNGDLPIHIAVSQRLQERYLIHYLASQDPGSILERNNHGLSPLHLVAVAPSSQVLSPLPDVVASHSDPSVLAARVLVAWCPDVVAFGNNEGLLPLHLAAQRGGSHLELVRLLVGERPATAMTPTRDGLLPLHFAAAVAAPMCRSDVEVARCLVECRPAAAMVATTDGTMRLPLHCALSDAHSWSADTSMEEQDSVRLSLARLLVETEPTSLQIEDGKGMIPLAVAALNPTTPLDVLFLLMAAWPGSVSALMGPSPSKRSQGRGNACATGPG